MSFNDTDPLEKDMRVRCEDMDVYQLIDYIRRYQKAFGRELAIEGHQEPSIFKGMKRIYGEKTAGLIVKWVFYRYHGVYKGEVVKFTDFAKGRKWWVDMMHQEMQAAQRREESRQAAPVTAGFASLADI